MKTRNLLYLMLLMPFFTFAGGSGNDNDRKGRPEKKEVKAAAQLPMQEIKKLEKKINRSATIRRINKKAVNPNYWYKG